MKELRNVLWAEIMGRIPSEASTGHHNERRTAAHERIMEFIETVFAEEGEKLDESITDYEDTQRIEELAAIGVH